MSETVRSRALELLNYDPLTGILTWRNSRGHLKAGSVAGAKQSNGYIRIQVDRDFHAAHRLIWLMIHGDWPSDDLDHINGQRADNRIANLRMATRSENLANTKVRSDSETGVKGVRIKRGKFAARIRIDGKETFLGTFETIEAASAAYAVAAHENFGAFARVA